MGRDPFHQPRVLRAPSSLALNPAREGAATASLDNLGQGLTTLRMKNFFLTSNLNLPSFSQKPLRLILNPLLPKPLQSPARGGQPGRLSGRALRNFPNRERFGVVLGAQGSFTLSVTFSTTIPRRPDCAAGKRARGEEEQGASGLWYPTPGRGEAGPACQRRPPFPGRQHHLLRAAREQPPSPAPAASSAPDPAPGASS